MSRFLTVFAVAACAVVALSAQYGNAEAADALLGVIEPIYIVDKMNVHRAKITGFVPFKNHADVPSVSAGPSTKKYKCNAFAEEFKTSFITDAVTTSSSTVAPTEGDIITTTTTLAPSVTTTTNASTASSSTVTTPSSTVAQSEEDAGESARSVADALGYTYSYFESTADITDDIVVNSFYEGITQFKGALPPVVKDNLSLYATSNAMGFVNMYTTQKDPTVACWKMTGCATRSAMCKFSPPSIKKTQATGPLTSAQFKEIVKAQESSASFVAPGVVALAALMMAFV